MMLALDDGQTLTYIDRDDKFDKFSAQYFQYENKESPLSLRLDLHLLASSLSELRVRLGPVTTRNKCNGDDDFFDGEPETIDIGSDDSEDDNQPSRGTVKRNSPSTRTKRGSRHGTSSYEVTSRTNPKRKKKESVAERQEQNKALVMKERESAEEKKAKMKQQKIAGKLNKGKVELSFDARKKYDRVLGEYASSVKQTKDEASRRAMYKFVQGSTLSSKMMSYGSERHNKNCPKGRVAGIFIDEVVPRPDLKSFELDCRREKPLTIAIGCSKEELVETLKYLSDNIDEVHFMNDPYEVDELVFGSDRKDLDSILRRNNGPKNVQKLKENAQALANNNTLEKTPIKNAKATEKEVEMDW